MGIEVEVLARELYETEIISEDGKDAVGNPLKYVPWSEVSTRVKDQFRVQARALASRLDISPRREQNQLSAAEAARRGFNDGRG